MADDYLTDDEQWEAVRHWIKENGPSVVAGVVLGAAALFGWRYFETYRNTNALKAAAQFSELTVALERNDSAKSRQIADGLIKEYPRSPYADQAQLTIARLYVDNEQLANAIAPLTQVMNNSKDSELRQIARLRLARVMIDQGKPDEAIKTLAAGTPGAFGARYHEVRGDALYAKKDIPGAATEYKAALAAGDPNSVDASLLELKIADLGATAAPPAKTASDTPNKAKP